MIGGWAHRLMFLHPSANRRHDPLTTNDVDILFKVSRTSVPLAQRLATAGFAARPREERPPAADYVHSEHPASPIEFLAPDVRSRKPSTPTKDIGGVSATTIKGLDLLLAAPWSIELTSALGFPVEEKLVVQVPNALAFVLHKLVVSTQRRDRYKREKDLLYAFDTLVLFAGSDGHLREDGPSVRKALSRSAVEKLRAMIPELAATSDAVRGAAQIAAQSGRVAPPLADQVGSTLAAALRRYLNDE